MGVVRADFVPKYATLQLNKTLSSRETSIAMSFRWY